MAGGGVAWLGGKEEKIIFMEVGNDMPWGCEGHEVMDGGVTGVR